MIKAVIVDDESGAINGLTYELQKFPDKIRVVDTFSSAIDAISGINYLKPDCVFLDIEMPEMNGFSLLQKLTYRDFAIVFTTAYDQYAIKAFKESALDYLLKPVDEEDIRSIIVKLEKQNLSSSFHNRFQETLDAFTKSNAKQMVQFPVNGKILFAKTDEIVYCESDGNYTNIFLDSSKSFCVSKKLKEVEALLPERTFFRVHNSFVINTLKVVEYIRAEGYVVLSNDKKISVSRIKKDAFLRKMVHC
ncbi:LytR/AlgR family response regulator transcription factor [Flagellimonas meridianipacifica]|uniref:Two-component system LytT family response regulator n=1 Tax=Flagellimonas meridianipacifica TaxID=1080225 RepID=A0A2T0MHG9_9FLAO|nr:LytTR family DNA-binding domain-containing protein [Allomuricauda pacifica]PRX57021.1 two-component system LytT family response regulator [Allomuricauda pacifica]